MYLTIVEGRPTERAAWLIDAMRSPANSERRSGKAIVDTFAVVPCAVQPLTSASIEFEPPTSAMDACRETLMASDRADDAESGHRTPRPAQLAALRYDLLHATKDGTRSLLAVRLHTGRRHQIRAQLAAHGHAILGDGRYGRKDGTSTLTTKLALHAVLLRLEHPIRGRGDLCVAAPIPAAWRQVCHGAARGLLEVALRLWDRAFGEGRTSAGYNNDRNNDHADMPPMGTK